MLLTPQAVAWAWIAKERNNLFLPVEHRSYNEIFKLTYIYIFFLLLFRHPGP